MFRIKRDSFWGRKLEQIEESAFEKSESVLREARNRKNPGEQEKRMLKDMERRHADLERKHRKRQTGHGKEKK